jgi:hypothetical protein
VKELSICHSLPCPDLVSFPVLSQIKPQAPLLVVPFRQFLQVSALRPYSPQNPNTLISLRLVRAIYILTHPPSRHRLPLRLRRYLIVFDPLTFVLDQRAHPWQMLSPSLVLCKSLNFTSDYKIQMPPTVPISHYRVPQNQQNRPPSYPIIPC